MEKPTRGVGILPIRAWNEFDPVLWSEYTREDGERIAVCLHRVGVLPDWAIRRFISIKPFVDHGECPKGMISYGLSSAGYDFRLGNKFLFPVLAPSKSIDPKNQETAEWKEVISDNPIDLPPHSFCLAETLETVWMPRNVIGIAIGKSSYARVGVLTNLTPIEPSWFGKITVEISNTAPIPAVIYPNEGIFQLMFSLMAGEPERSYDDKKGAYQGQTGIKTATVK
jgi:dCTP deaminase